MNAARYKQRGPGRKYPLTGFTFYGVCGLKLHTKPRSEAGSSTRFVCTKKRIEGPQGCGSISRNIAPVEYLVTETVLCRLDSLQLARLMNGGTDDERKAK